jgi:hypothetical protein
MDRNVWDRVTPQGFVELRADALTVELCVYVMQHSAKKPEQVRADVELARDIWCQGKINIQAVHWETLAPLIDVVGPLDLTSADLAGQIPCATLSNDARRQLFAIGKPHSPAGDPTRFIAVYYIPGSNLQEGASGCHSFQFQGEAPPEHMILLTDRADGRVLAHELGHALFTRAAGPQSWTNDDPDPSQSAGDRLHNANPQNLMYPNVSADPRISPEQVTVAQRSHLVTLQQLTFGFRENKRHKLGVTLKTLHVDWAHDEALSDDALESNWTFAVGTRNTKGTRPYTHNRLKSGDYKLSDTYDYPLLEVGSDNDELTIDVTGTDWDFWSPNDPLPEIHKKWPKGTDLWGSMSSDNGDPVGQHTEGPLENSEIKYSMTYAIRVDDAPDEQIFRRIC